MTAASDRSTIPNSQPGQRSNIHGLATILGSVEGLEHAVILGPGVLGHPAAATYPGPLVMGEGAVIHAFAVLYQASQLEARLRVSHDAFIREGHLIGHDASVGSSAHLQPGNVIGAHYRIHSGGILSSATRGEDVLCGPNVTFTDDPNPPCPTSPNCRTGVTIGHRVSIGGNITLLPGVDVGDRCLVGAGAIVTRSINPGNVVAGNPARVLGRRDSLTCAAHSTHRMPGAHSNTESTNQGHQWTS